MQRVEILRNHGEVLAHGLLPSSLVISNGKNLKTTLAVVRGNGAALVVGSTPTIPSDTEKRGNNRLAESLFNLLSSVGGVPAACFFSRPTRRGTSSARLSDAHEPGQDIVRAGRPQERRERGEMRRQTEGT